MIGNKYLSELIDLSALKIDALNVVKAPTGSGKTYFALTAIPASIGEKALWQVVYLIDTINGKEQILRNYNAHSYCKAWDEIATDEILYWGDGEESVVIMTYAKFGKLLESRPDFHTHFKYIICDELPSAIQYQYFEKRPNLCSIALHGLERAVRNDSTTVIALTATPNQIYGNLDAPCYDVPIDEAELMQYTVGAIRKYTNLEYLIEQKIGICPVLLIRSNTAIMYKQQYTSTTDYLDLLKQFDGVITPDCSLLVGQSACLQQTNTYFNRAVGYCLQKHGIPVIANIRWSDEASFDYCFLGVPQKAIVAVSTHRYFDFRMTIGTSQ